MQDEPPVIVDWSPWHHTAGGNHDVGLVLYNGGTFYIDDGKPTPGAIGETVRNLREVSPTWYFNVPKGFEALLPYLRSDDTLRRTFFSRLKVLWFAGAGIAQHVFDEVQQLAVETCGERILFLTGFGSTETAPYALARTWHSGNATNVGLPAIGLDMKLVPTEGKLEGRAARAEHHAGLLAAAGADRGRVRRGRFLPARRRVPARRRKRRFQRACCSKAAPRRTSSSTPAPGSMSDHCARSSSRILRRWCATS